MEEEGVLESLGNASSVPLRTKLALACVSNRSKAIVGGHLRVDDLWVHPSDCIVACARWLAGRARSNAKLRVHVFGGLEGAYSSLGACYEAASRGPLGGAQAVTFPLGRLPGRVHQHSLATTMDRTLAFFLGHVLVSVPRADVEVTTSNGSYLNLHNISHSHNGTGLATGAAHAQTLRFTEGDWAALAGAFLECALRMTALSKTLRGRVLPLVSKFAQMQLDDDAMQYVGRNMRAEAHAMRGVDFAKNRFGVVGITELFSSHPQRTRMSLLMQPVIYPQLTNMTFEGTPVGGGGVGRLVQALCSGCLPRLHHLRLSRTHMGTFDARTLFTALGTKHAANLETLDVSNNPFDGKALEPLKHYGWKAERLRTLGMFGLRLDSNDYAIVASAIMQVKLPMLKEVRVYAASGRSVALALNARKAIATAQLEIARASSVDEGAKPSRGKYLPAIPKPTVPQRHPEDPSEDEEEEEEEFTSSEEEEEEDDDDDDVSDDDDDDFDDNNDASSVDE